jgi:maleylacetoacetate isomerase/maleylpyruvate isomerase
VKLYTYWRSTASYRVRVALALKGIESAQGFVHLVRGGGEHRQEPFRTLNPQMRA